MRGSGKILSLCVIGALLAAAGCGSPQAQIAVYDSGNPDITAGNEFYEQAQQQAGLLQEPPEIQAALWPGTGVTRLVREKKRQNPDTVGWLYIPDTDINQVVVQNPPHESNDYYLNLSFAGEPDKNGTYCVDRRASIGRGSREELSRITTIYGHSWDDDPEGELFAQLKKYRDPQFAQEHPYIYFSTGSEHMVWEVFAVFEAGVDLGYNVPDLDDARFYDMLDLAEAASLHRYGAVVTPEDKVLTLSTCIFSVQGYDNLPEMNDYRFAVMARLVKAGEPLKKQAVLSANAQPLSPEGISKALEDGAMRVYPWGNNW